MYLAKLYKQHKWWFAIVILFAFGQIFINYKNGVMFSPFYNYDMFSYAYQPKKQYEVVQVCINGSPLQPKQFSAHEWDNLMQPITFFNKQKEWNSLIFNTEVQKFLHVQDSSLFVNTILEKMFTDWYRQQVLRIANVRDTNSLIMIRKDTFLLAQQYLYNR